MQKAMGIYCTYSFPGKTAALVLEFAVEDLPSAELQPRFLHVYLYIYIYRGGRSVRAAVLQHVRKYFAFILLFSLLSQPLIISQLANFKLQNK